MPPTPNFWDRRRSVADEKKIAWWVSNRYAVFELPGVRGLNPLPHLADPPLLVKIRPRGGRVSTPHLSFAEIGMLFDSHFLLMQFLKYLQGEDLNVTTILIHIED